MTEDENGSAALAEWVRSNTQGTFPVATVSDAVLFTEDNALQAPFIVAVRAGYKLESLKPLFDAVRKRPERIEGTAVMLDLASFIAHVNRFKNPATGLFANPDRTAPSLTAVIDYHDAVRGDDPMIAFHSVPLPSFCVHRTTYHFPLSEEWTAWTSKSGVKMNQAEFAEFLEDRIGDVLVPPTQAKIDEDEKAGVESASIALVRKLGGRYATPQALVELSRGLAVHQNERVKAAVNISTGEVQVAYEAAHQNEAGEALRVPNLFLIGIPVFRLGAPYEVAVRLRYRLAGGQIAWFFELYRADKVFEHAVTEAAAEASRETGLAILMGKPEARATR